MNDLIKRLSQGEHPVVVGGSQPSLAELQQRIETLGYVFVKFTETQGQTNLGMRVDRSATDVSQANFEQGSGSAHIEGTLTLDYVRVRCLADIDLATLQGTGRLQVLEEVRP
jgi:hypothetical protein